MNHTPEIKKAIQFAARKHHGQMRLEKEPLPYVTHLFSAALLVAETGASDDIVIATLLHDTLEDTDTTREEIVEAFNEHVVTLVEAVSEPKEADGKKLSWRERKERYLAQIEAASTDALLISIADKIDNLESRIESFEREGQSFLKNFGQPLSEYFWFHGEVLRVAEARLPDHPLTKRLAEVRAKEQRVFGNI